MNRPIDPEKVTQLAASIQETGLLQPILLNSEGKVIAGHHRLEALKKLGRDRLNKKEYRILDLDALHQELARIDENLVRSQLSWQEEALALARRKELFEELHPETRQGGDRTTKKGSSQKEKISSFCDETAKRMGMSPRTIRQKVELAKIIEKHDDLAQCPTAAEARFHFKKRQHEEERYSESQDKEFRNRVIEGDCLEHIEKLENRSISCCLSDPPYGINLAPKRMGGENQKRILNDDEKAFPLLDAMLKTLRPKMKAKGSVYLFCSWKTIRQFLEITEKYFEVKNVLVWVKQNHGIGNLNSWAEKHEFCIYATLGKHMTFGERPVNVLHFDRTNQHHPCEKPVDMLCHILEKSTLKGELVIDPFAGSGSTGVACKKMGRPFKLYELDPENVKIIRRRLQNMT